MLLESMLQQYFFKAGEKHQNVLVPSYILKIVLNLEKMPVKTEGTARDVEVDYNYYTRVIECDPIQVVGIQSKDLDEGAKAINLHESDFVPFTRCSADVSYSNWFKLSLNDYIFRILTSF